MLIYLVLVICILVLNIARKNGNITNKTFCILICVAFVLITGLRHNDVGSDTTNYYFGFNALNGYTLPQIIAMEKRDFGFYIFEWLVYHFFQNFTVLTVIVACLFYIPVSILIFKYSDDCGLSYLILMAFSFFQFSMTGIRQTMALGFAVMLMLELLEENPNIVRSALWIVLGIIVHRSCLVVIPFLLIRIYKNKKWVAYACLFLIPVFFVFRSQMTGAALNLFNNIGFDLTTFVGNNGGFTTFLVYILLFVWGLFFTYSGENFDEMPTLFLIMMGITAVLQNFVFVNSIFFRVVWYYSIFMVIYIPRMIYSSRTGRSGIRLMNAFIYMGLLYMYFKITIGAATVLPYHFFWQG